MTQGRPKHFVKLIGDFTLLQETARRVAAMTAARDIILVTLDSMREEAEAQLDALNLPVQFHFVTEPSARNTAAAVAMATAYVERHMGRDATVWIAPADHYIGDEKALNAALTEAKRLTDDGYLAILGITPLRPETGYGYIRLGAALGGEARKVMTFVEKPDFEMARSYITQGFLWNSGMVVARVAAMLDQFRLCAPEFLGISMDDYDAVPSKPFDRAVLEKSDKVAVIPCDPDWSDIGTMEGLAEILGRVGRDDVNNI